VQPRSEEKNDFSIDKGRMKISITWECNSFYAISVKPLEAWLQSTRSSAATASQHTNLPGMAIKMKKVILVEI
jgi:hypothetical protein